MHPPNTEWDCSRATPCTCIRSEFGLFFSCTNFAEVYHCNSLFPIMSLFNSFYIDSLFANVRNTKNLHRNIFGQRNFALVAVTCPMRCKTTILLGTVGKNCYCKECFCPAWGVSASEVCFFPQPHLLRTEIMPQILICQFIF